MLFLVISFFLRLVISAAVLWLAARITKNPVAFVLLLVIALVGSILGAIPMVGWLASLLAMGYLLAKFGDMEVWPDVVLTMLVAVGLNILLGFALLAMLAPLLVR